jgi:hypothetical protein
MKKKNSIKKEFVQVGAVGNGWMIQMSKAKKMLLFTDSKRDAMSVARSLAKRKKTDIVVYPKKGEVVTIKDYAA